MHIVNVKYVKALTVVDAHIAEHRAWLETLFAEGVLLGEGPQVPRSGGILLVNGSTSREDLEAILLQDPFRRHKIAQYEVITFTLAKRGPLLSGTDEKNASIL